MGAILSGLEVFRLEAFGIEVPGLENIGFEDWNSCKGEITASVLNFRQMYPGLRLDESNSTKSQEYVSKIYWSFATVATKILGF